MQTKKFKVLILMAVALAFVGCGKKDAATVAAGTSVVTIKGSGSAN